MQEISPISRVFFCGKFLSLGNKTKRLANPTKGLLRIKKKIHHISRKKSYELPNLNSVSH